MSSSSFYPKSVQNNSVLRYIVVNLQESGLEVSQLKTHPPPISRDTPSPPQKGTRPRLQTAQDVRENHTCRLAT